MNAPNTPRRLRIERLELDLRGIAPATAEAAARALGPALAQALAADARHGAVPARTLDAGRIPAPACADAQQLAAHIARQIARAVGQGEAP